MKFVILMAGPAVSGEDVLLEQNRLIYAQRGAPQERIDAQLASIRDLAALLGTGDVDGARARAKQAITAELDASGVPQDQRPSPEQIDQRVAIVTAPVFAAFLAHGPGPALRALQCPSSRCSATRTCRCRPRRASQRCGPHWWGDPDVTTRTFPGLNHLMQPTTTGAVTEYGTIETTIDPQLLELVRSWAVARFVK